MPRYCLDLDTPAGGFIDSYLIGNGWLGATLNGGIGTERLDLNLDTVWSGGPLVPEEGESPALLLGELRAAIQARDYLRADEIGRRMQGKRWTHSYQPLGAIELTYTDSDGAMNYTRRLDLSEAVASSAYDTAMGSIRFDSFVSSPDGVLVALATGSGVRGLPHAGLDFRSPHPRTQITNTEEAGVRWLTAAARVPVEVVPNYIENQKPVTYAEDAVDTDGSIAAGMGYAVVAALARDPAGGLRLIASAASGFRGHDKRPSADLAALAAEAKSRVVAALAASTETLRRRHRDDYRSFFDRVDLDLSGSPAIDGADPARDELLFHFGRYLLISSSRPGTEAANLQGIWNVDVRPAWSSNYTININTQMNYWPAESAGLADLHQPMFTLTRELAAAGAATARRYYGAAGAAAHHNADLWRFTAPVPGIPQWSNWPSGLYWMAAHVQHHIDYGSAGPSFTADTALPVFRAAAAFALDMLVEDDDGALVASPSTSPEHSFIVGGTAVAITRGAAMDQELIREVLQSYVALADDPLAARARQALGRLRLPIIGANGTLLEWDDDKTPAEFGHRHLSHLYGLYPGIRITETGTPGAFEAARRALYLRLDNGTGYTGWSQAWVLCLAARLGDHALASRSIASLLDRLTSRSLLVLHPLTDWPGGNVFQIDGNFGAVAGLTELVVQSHAGAISLMKALPPSWTDGSITDIRCRGGHRVSVSWRQGRFDRASIVSGASGPLTLDLPSGNYAVSSASDNAIPVEAAEGVVFGRASLGWQTSSGARYTVTARSAI
ncbi:MAG: glycoside hydrolase family 95 protein [Devosia nanyangense]|uniref:Glycoside hydrolase family 95 protein n=1 Tax=Devosia nanyangense TaxID=1228055 RepID=A0A933NYM9_9HYPH|nr:glycoside hydrolase family 95 protein [Devosia nanyangense]